MSLIGLLILVFGGYSLNHPKIETVTQGPVDPGFYRVVRIDDGDTITVDMNGTNEKVRFLGVDTPETQHPSKPVQCFGKAATEFTKEQIGSQAVRLEADPLNSNRDRYDRLLRYVYLPDDTLLNEELIKQGYGFAYTAFPLEKTEEFESLEEQARKNETGLWGSCDIKTSEFGDPESPAA